MKRREYGWLVITFDAGEVSVEGSLEESVFGCNTHTHRARENERSPSEIAPLSRSVEEMEGEGKGSVDTVLLPSMEERQ